MYSLSWPQTLGDRRSTQSGVQAIDSAAKWQAAVSPLVKQISNGNWLAPTEAESLRDELYYKRAVHAYRHPPGGHAFCSLTHIAEQLHGSQTAHCRATRQQGGTRS